MAISAVAEGCQKQMEPLLPNIVETILPFLGDSVSCQQFLILMYSFRGHQQESNRLYCMVYQGGLKKISNLHLN